jgi:hypothetical protein
VAKAWEEWSWEPSEWSVTSATGRFETIRSGAQALLIIAPTGSRFEGGRLKTFFSQGGLDATSVAHCARHRLDGFDLAGDETAPVGDEPVEAAELPAAAATEPPPRRWGIAFASRALPLRRSWLTDRDRRTGPIVSTNDQGKAATWDKRDDAIGWLEDAGLDPDKPLPIGVGFLYPVVTEIGMEFEPGIEFELPRTLLRRSRPAASAPPDCQPAEEPPKPPVQSRSRAARDQQTFMFAD